MVKFNKPPFLGKELDYMTEAVNLHKLSGDGSFTSRCHSLLEDITTTKKALLTTSCTHALEMAAILCNIQPGDEVIMPSYTFVSTANAFVLRGATIVFVDIRPDTMNIDEKQIEAAITDKTKAIIPVHYAGVSCDMDIIMNIAYEHKLFVVEDAAQGVGSYYNKKPLGSIGDFGTFSFHETKNISCGEGGALLINNKDFIERAEIIREKGTNRSRFFRGEIDKYTWCDIGSSYLPSEICAAYLLAQLEKIEHINQNRLNTWEFYHKNLKHLEEMGYIELAHIPSNCEHNSHMFWLKVRDLQERTKFIQFLKDSGVYSVFHYIPLHSSPAGLKLGRFNGYDIYTTIESERLVRLPFYYGMASDDMLKVVEVVSSFYDSYQKI